MVWIKFILVVLLCVPLCIGIYALVGHLLHHSRSGHVSKESLEVSVLSKFPNGVSSPPAEVLLSPITSVGEKLLKSAVDSLLTYEQSRYQQSYSFRISRDDFYISGGALANKFRLEELIVGAIGRLKELQDNPTSADELVAFQDELDVAEPHLEYFNPNNSCSIGLIRMVRKVLINGTKEVACTIELVPVSNETGTLLKFKLWKLRLNYAKSLIGRWRGGLDMAIGLRLVGVDRSEDNQLVQRVLLDDVVELKGVDLGRTYETKELGNVETFWFPFPSQLEFKVGFNQGPDTTVTRKDFGNYTLTAVVIEKGH